jgi:hypothetical protein
MSNEVGYPEVLDVVGYNYQEFRYPEDHVKYPNRIIYGSENGMALSAWKAVDENEYISAQYLWTGVDYLGEARSWPARSNMAGLIDLAGFTKPSYYFRQSLWSDKPMIYIGTSALSNRGNNRRGITSSWKYNEGDSVLITCYTNCDEAELFLNGQSLGRKQLNDSLKNIIWRTVYQTGELSVKGYKNGKEATQSVLKTNSEAYAIKAAADRSAFNPKQKQLTHIEISIVDKNGIPVANAENEISISIEGPAKLLGLESGSSVSHEDYQSNKRKAMNGRLLAYVQSQAQPGAVKITIQSEGLQPHVLVIR